MTITSDKEYIFDINVTNELLLTLTINKNSISHQFDSDNFDRRYYSKFIKLAFAIGDDIDYHMEFIKFNRGILSFDNLDINVNCINRQDIINNLLKIANELKRVSDLNKQNVILDSKLDDTLIVKLIVKSPVILSRHKNRSRKHNITKQKYKYLKEKIDIINIRDEEIENANKKRKSN